jgi:AcrR family transcriptional regulator
MFDKTSLNQLDRIGYFRQVSRIIGFSVRVIVIQKRKGRRSPSLVQRLRTHLPAGDRDRRSEILDTAAQLFGSSGFRTSLQEIAEACGIQAGSLYHHFDSKEAIIVDLVKRYQIELDGLAMIALDDLARGESKPVLDRVISLAEAIASCASRHRAALVQTFYEPPSTAGKQLVRLARQTPRAIDDAMLKILQAGKDQGAIRSGIELAHLAEQICQSMLHTAVGVLPKDTDARQFPELKCRILLEGLATQCPENFKLNRSAAFAIADQVIASWDTKEEKGQAATLRAAAKAEFGRRGYEATTIRDIASAAGMSTGTVYRLVESKDELLMSIMASHIQNVLGGWDAVMDARSTSVEKLDALLWLDINMLDRFRDEFMIQLAFVRELPPPTSSQLGEFTNIPRHIQALLETGENAGHFRNIGDSVFLRVHGLIELVWMSVHIVRNVGTRKALSLARDTILRGAIKR